MRTRNGRRGERGQILVLFALVLVLLMGLAALAVDVGVLRNANQNLWNALDAGSLAGASQLPADGTNADALARDFINRNYPGDPPNNIAVSFRCLIGSVGGSPRLSDVPSVCDPGPGVIWTCNAAVCVAFCEPSAGDSCNTIVVTGEVTVPYGFGNAIGVPEGSTGTVTSAACKGPCGAAPETPIDVVLILDRTGSMAPGGDTTDLENMRTAAQSLRTDPNLDPAHTWLALGMIGPSQQSGGCPTADAPTLGTSTMPADLPRWIPVGLSGTGGAPVPGSYKSSSSALANGLTCFGVSNTYTDLADPMEGARYTLRNSPRYGVATQGIIFMTDGLPNNSVSKGGGGCSSTATSYITEVQSEATRTKDLGITIFTVGFGLEPPHGSGCGSTWDGPSPWVRARGLLAGMASPVDGVPAVDNGCNDAENNDDDNFYCVPKAGGAASKLAQAFKSALNSLVGSTKLVQLP